MAGLAVSSFLSLPPALACGLAETRVPVAACAVMGPSATRHAGAGG